MKIQTTLSRWKSDMEITKKRAETRYQKTHSEIEEKMLLICRTLTYEHDELKKFNAGFGKFEPCDCPACVAARELFGEKL